jgi:hypothetical protein
MNKLKAYHNDKSIKDKYVKRVTWHFEQDNIIRGIGWDGGKGCAIGCTLEKYDPSQYPIELGIPEWLARVEDTLFEGMSKDKSRTWPIDFLRAVNIGSDLEAIKAPFLIFALKDTLETFDSLEYPDVKKAVEVTIALWERDDIGSADWQEAADAAGSAAKTAADAARAAAKTAADAARAAAWAAADAAEAAVWAAWAAADAAEGVVAKTVACAAAYDRYADEILSLIKECR